MRLGQRCFEDYVRAGDILRMEPQVTRSADAEGHVIILTVVLADVKVSVLAEADMQRLRFLQGALFLFANHLDEVSGNHFLTDFFNFAFAGGREQRGIEAGKILQHFLGRGDLQRNLALRTLIFVVALIIGLRVFRGREDGRELDGDAFAVVDVDKLGLRLALAQLVNVGHNRVGQHTLLLGVFGMGEVLL